MFVASTHKKSHVMKANKSRIGLQFICFNTEPVYLECYICFLFSHRSFLAMIRCFIIAVINHNCSLSDHKRSNSNNRCWFTLITIYNYGVNVPGSGANISEAGCRRPQLLLVTAWHHAPASAGSFLPLTAAAIRGWDPGLMWPLAISPSVLRAEPQSVSS